MKQSIFKISQMDCPSEEQMIRMKLADQTSIKQLDFDIPNRKLTVFHDGDTPTISGLLNELNLGSEFQSESNAEDLKIAPTDTSKERRILWSVLLINFTFFLLEILFGLFSKSMGLVADSLDMLADSIVYGLSLLAVGHSMVRKKKIAKWSGYFQMTLALIGLIEVIRRFIGHESIPIFQTMIVVSFLALIANAVSMYLIQKAKSKEAHMQASAIFTSNDIIINIGVIIAGALVFYTNSQIPDLIIGSIVFLIVIRGAFRILQLAK